MFKIHTVEKTEIVKKKKFYHRYWFIFLSSAFVLGVLLLIGISQYNSYQKRVKYESEVKIAKLKEKALIGLATQIVGFVNNQDWANLYDKGASKTLQNYVTKEQFVSSWTNALKNGDFYSKHFIITGNHINGDKGTVDETIVICVTKNCTGDNRKEIPAPTNFIYVNGVWAVADDQKPSDKAMSLAAELYTIAPLSGQQIIMKGWGDGFNSVPYAVFNWASWLDQNPAEIALAEAAINKVKLQGTNSSQSTVTSSNSISPETYQNYGWYMHNGQSMQYVNGQWYTSPQQNNSQPAQAKSNVGYTSTYIPPLIQMPQYLVPDYSGQALRSLQTLDNNLQNIVNQNTLQNQMIQTNYQLQEINNALRY